ncbi:UDP-glucuronosyltransferase 1-7, partial [Orchesella cincta]
LNHALDTINEMVQPSSSSNLLQTLSKMIALKHLVFWTVFYIIPCANCANILFFFVGGTHSHDIPIWPLVVKLADRNHSVTFFSAHTRKPWKDPRIELLIPEEVKKINDRYLGDVMSLRLRGEERLVWESIPTWSYEICEYILRHPEVPENYIEPYYWTYKRRTQFFPKLDKLMREFFETDNITSFEELERKTDLLFVNTHPSVELPRSLPPNIISVGGMQMYGQKNATIPKDIENFVNSAEQGFILIAFGSSIDFSSIPAAFELAFFDAINRFPKIHFLVKATSEAPKNCPKNLKYKPWAPQKELMAHPKTLACITHSGLNGIIEATWTGVPLILIPIFAEQDYQAYKLQAREVGIRLELRDINADDLTSAIYNITTNPMYRNNMKKLQAAFQDRPQSPIDLAVYWTEFTLRHDDLSFMNPIIYQPWRVYIESLLFTPALPWVALITTLSVIILTISIFRG